ncbi:hypothetical protein [Geodermatophilus chilensis]|uniref:hypothetical protein n=1 Tax=Geodermatophilus chilensis TaxID=2035835 RepID=UPI0012FFF7E4|nr:hypothetical protein [Geodermatophilus chilensis]
MASGRIRRTARRGLTVLLLGWLAAVGGAVLTAPSAGAAPSATVEIRDVTPPVVSVDAGGSVTFVNRIADKRVQVGIGPVGVTDVTVTTEVSLRLPSGTRVLAPGQSVTERFDASCVTCAITYTYRARSGPGLTDALLGQAVAQLPALPVGVPLVVNTILPDLPALPSVNVPSVPSINPVPPVPPGPPTPPVDGPDGDPEPTDPQPTPQPAQSLGGTPYSYDTGGGSARMAPVDGAVAAAFDPSRFAATSGASGTDGVRSVAAAGGSGGAAGTYDGASVPVFGRLAGLDDPDLTEESAAGTDVAADGATGQALPLAALVAVVVLASTTAALVRTHLAHR